MSIEALSIVLNHSRATVSAKLVLLGIANHLGPDAWEGAWPSQRRLADYANITERGVQEAIKKLVELGELRVSVAAGNSRNQYKPNLYWIDVECPDDCDRSMGHRKVAQKDPQGHTPVPAGSHPSSGRVTPQCVGTVIEPEKNLNAKVSQSQEGFDEFWKVYPRGEDKPDARKAFARALKRVSFEDLIAGAIRHRDDPNRNPQWTKYAHRWLDKDGWDNSLKPATEVLNEWGRPFAKSAESPGVRAWVKAGHDRGEHWACRPGEFEGC